MGAGDVKLLAAIGAWLGPGPLWVALFSLIAGGVMGLVVALAFGLSDPGDREHLVDVPILAPGGAEAGARRHSGDTSRARLAYAVPVLAGLMVTLWLK